MKRYNFFFKLISKFIYDTFMINFHTYFYRNQYESVCFVILLYLKWFFFEEQLICKNKTFNFLDSNGIEEM